MRTIGDDEIGGYGKAFCSHKPLFHFTEFHKQVFRDVASELSCDWRELWTRQSARWFNSNEILYDIGGVEVLVVSQRGVVEMSSSELRDYFKSVYEEAKASVVK